MEKNKSVLLEFLRGLSTIILDWKSWTVIGLLIAAAAAQVFLYFRRQEAERKASDAGNVFALRQGNGYVFFPCGLSHYRSLYIGEEGVIIETESGSERLLWPEINYVVKSANPSTRALRETYRLLFYPETDGEHPVVLHLGSFRSEEIKLILKLLRKRVRLVERR